ncbi:deleted in malignant brain tumors 1 protein-like, partial [Strongylocentrotus purpuratus]|uniref:SRCR domain-containing protein n=2 Tax=Eleutherozoa TaxID=133551 RepID=A0A7M7NF33_STRPU
MDVDLNNADVVCRMLGYPLHPTIGAALTSVKDQVRSYSTTEPPYSGCSSYEWQCYYNGQCIQDYQRCNGYTDCYYGEDESNCYDYTTEPSNSGCSSNEWACYYYGQCIQDYQRCNGYSDCYFGEDEYNCTGNTVAPTVDVNPPSSVLRLVNGSTIYEGRVEVFVNGSWGTACSHSWDMNEAQVICRQLGYGPAINAPGYATYGPAPVRLVNGSSSNEGQVEVFYQGEWGTVCDDGWDLNNADVVCRMLGYPSASNAWSGAHFGQGSGPIMLDNVNCQGYESSIAECNHAGWFSHNCGHNEDAGVTCNSDSTTEPPYSGCSSYEWQCYYNGQCIQDYQRCNGYTDCYYGEDESNCYDYTTEPSNSGCSSNEWACYYYGQCIQDYQRCNGYSDCYFGEDEYNCTGNTVAPTVDVNPPSSVLRLVNGSTIYEGRVEVFVNGSWGTACSHSWDMNEAQVICRQLGYGPAINAPATLPMARVLVLFTLYMCTATVRKAQYLTAHLITLNTALTVKMPVLNAQWGTVCDDGWDLNNADVVCRMLGYPSASNAWSGAHFGQGSGPIMLDNVNCQGYESSIAECNHAGWDYTTEPSNSGCSSNEWACYYYGQCIQDYQRCNGYSDCYFGEDDEYNCTAPVRLVNGSSSNEGQVEVFYQGEWGTVCDDGWDLNNADVVCRMLGYPSASNAWSGAHFGQGSDSTTEPPYSGCSSYEWQCYYNGQCIQDYQRCNGYTDCYYGEDESNCYDYTTEPSNSGCSSNEWACYYYGQCIQDYQRCNGYSDCYFGEDEYNCTGNTVAPTVDVNPPSSVLRLVNGSTIYEGRVEVFVNGSWGTACSHSWDMNEAQVICRQLGYGPAINAPGYATYGPGVGPIHLVHVHCNGSESSILDCTSYYSEHCSHSEDAGVECSAPVRLVNGSSSNEGQVEVFYQGEWGTVCDDGWDLNNADVVCRMLGYPSASNAWSGAHFGQGSDSTTEPPYSGCSSYEWQCYYNGQCIQDYQRCNGYTDCYYGEDESNCYDYTTEPSNSGCSSNEWACYYYGQCIQDYQRCNGYSDCYFGEDEYNCTGNTVAPTVDVNPPSSVLRLVNGSTIYEGRVEVFVNGSWGTACSHSWDMNEAQVICRQLGYGPAINAPGYATYGPGVGPIHLVHVHCNGSESSILDCTSYYSEHCSHSEDAGVECSAPVRLVNGSSSNEGQVEVFYQGEWGTVCDDGWDLNNADVVCRMLGYPSASNAWSGAHFGQGSGPIMLDNVNCQGYESSIAECNHAGWFSHNCGHNEDAGVTCNSDSTTEPPYSGCSSYEWQCYYNGQCIQDYQRCNGYTDCYYGEDESNCYDYTTEPSNSGCSSNEWACYYYGQCIQDYQRCNGYSDCYFGEDEYNCTGNTVAPTVDVNPPSSVLRLVNGSTIYEGRVEVFVNGSWGTACSHSWDMNEAKSSADSLDMDQPLMPRATLPMARLQFSSREWNSSNEGQVEVFYQGEWGTVCDDGWDLIMLMSSVACLVTLLHPTLGAALTSVKDQ